MNNVLNCLKKKYLDYQEITITKLANAAYPESHSVSLFMVSAFHGSTFLQLGVYRLHVSVL